MKTREAAFWTAEDIVKRARAVQLAGEDDRMVVVAEQDLPAPVPEWRSTARAIRAGLRPWCPCGATTMHVGDSWPARPPVQVKGHAADCFAVKPWLYASYAGVEALVPGWQERGRVRYAEEHRQWRDKPRVDDYADKASDEQSRFLTLSELRELPEVEMFFDKIVPCGSLGYITGRDGTYKTFLALDLAMHVIALKDDRNGRAVGEADRVLYVAGEGVASFPKRIAAWAEHHEFALESWHEESLVIYNGAVDLYAGAAAFQDLLTYVGRFAPDLIFIDTLNRSAGAAEQNSATDMSVITSRIADLKDAGNAGCTVIVVAHTSKNDEDARGSSAIEDDADFVLHCKTDEDRLRLRIAKMKDGESGQDILLRAVPVADSLVLVAAAPEPDWLSDNLAARITGVLFAVRGQDEPTATQLLALTKDDGTGKAAGRSKVYNVLGDLVRTGAVVQNKEGAKAATFRLDPSQYPPDVKP